MEKLQTSSTNNLSKETVQKKRPNGDLLLDLTWRACLFCQSFYVEINNEGKNWFNSAMIP